MNFLNLEYFLVAAEELNFTRAAKRLFISQQSLSGHILKLEEYFGVPLFDRTPPLTLTNEGICLYKRGKELLQMREDLVKEIRDINDFSYSDLTVACPFAIGRAILPQILPEFARRFPKVNLHVLEGSTESVEASLLEGRADLLLGLTPKENERLRVEDLCSDRLMVVVPDTVLQQFLPETAEDVKVRLRNEQDIALLQGCPFLMIHSSTSTGARIDELVRKMAIDLHIKLESNNMEMLIELCRKGMGVLFCPEFTLNSKWDVFSEGFTVFAVREENTKNHITVSYLHSKYLSKAAQAFIDLAKEKIGEPC